jgi:hypothetical protein
VSGHRRPVTPLTRELACLALGHADSDRTPCTATDEELMRELTEEVQRLRILLGAGARP